MEIHDRMELHAILDMEKAIYLPHGIKDRISKMILCDERYVIYKYLRYLRLQEYYMSCSSTISHMIYDYYTRKKNKLGNRIQIKIIPHAVGKGINIHHRNVIINGQIGCNAVFHGNNCIGSNPMTAGGTTPIVGDDCEFGYGSCAFGDIRIAKHVKVGAGAIVVKSILEDSSVWVGIPAHILKR